MSRSFLFDPLMSRDCPWKLIRCKPKKKVKSKWCHFICFCDTGWQVLVHSLLTFWLPVFITDRKQGTELYWGYTFCQNDAALVTKIYKCNLGTSSTLPFTCDPYCHISSVWSITAHDRDPQSATQCNANLFLLSTQILWVCKRKDHRLFIVRGKVVSITKWTGKILCGQNCSTATSYLISVFGVSCQSLLSWPFNCLHYIVLMSWYS